MKIIIAVRDRFMADIPCLLSSPEFCALLFLGSLAISDNDVIALFILLITVCMIAFRQPSSASSSSKAVSFTFVGHGQVFILSGFSCISSYSVKSL